MKVSVSVYSTSWLKKKKLKINERKRGPYFIRFNYHIGGNGKSLHYIRLKCYAPMTKNINSWRQGKKKTKPAWRDV